jgi:hypothetical protein
MQRKQKLKRVSETHRDNEQPHRILNEMEFPKGTEFTTDDSDGIVTIRINKIKYENY